jgi:RNA:NAD 2'-phosphotransferase (TPT1/KptA family)
VYNELSKAVSHALRHEPSAYGLVPDARGWVKVQDLPVSL